MASNFNKDLDINHLRMGSTDNRLDAGNKQPVKSADVQSILSGLEVRTLPLNDMTLVTQEMEVELLYPTAERSSSMH